MYFDITPKTKITDLFGRGYVVDSIINSLRDPAVRIVVLEGLRRTGKTSVMNVVLNEIKEKKIKIDVRGAPYYDRKEFMQYVVESVKQEIGTTLFEKLIKLISQIKISYKDLSASFFLNIEKNFILFFENLNKQLEKKGKIFILAFDEVQLLSKINFDAQIAAIFDNCRQIKLILTGSEIGLVEGFLGKRNANSLLFGRAFIEIKIKKLTDEEVSSFLKAGFVQIEKTISLKEITDIIGVLDGIIGWSTHYGWLRKLGNNHQKAMNIVIDEGIKLAKKELDTFLENRTKLNYIQLLRFISKGNNKWNLFKREYAKKGKKMTDRQLNLYLNELLNYSFIEKINDEYFITDPLLVRSLETI